MNTSPRYRVCFIDSGIGGLSIYSAFRSQAPAVDTLYCADYAFFPYGLKTEKALLQRMIALVEMLSQRYTFNLLVIPCNTASTLLLDVLRKSVSFPIVGTVPAIKTASQVSQTHVIGVLATKATVSRSYTQKLEEQFASTCTVIRCGSSRLVEIAEEKLQGIFPSALEIQAEVKVLQKEKKLDTVVLACTHFSFLQAELQAAFDRPIQWVDSVSAVAKRAISLLPLSALQQATPGSTVFLSTSSLLSRELEQVLREKFSFSIEKMDF